MIEEIGKLIGVSYGVIVYCMDRVKYEKKLEEKQLGWGVITST